jgi:hypothetical protein
MKVRSNVTWTDEHLLFEVSFIKCLDRISSLEHAITTPFIAHTMLTAAHSVPTHVASRAGRTTLAHAPAAPPREPKRMDGMPDSSPTKMSSSRRTRSCEALIWTVTSRASFRREPETYARPTAGSTEKGAFAMWPSAARSSLPESKHARGMAAVMRSAPRSSL